MLVFVMVFVSRFGRSSVRIMIVGYRCILCRGFGFIFNTVLFLSYFLTLKPSVNGFAELPATMAGELGCHVGIHFK